MAIFFLVLFTGNPAAGQFIPNAPFKMDHAYAPDFSLQDLQGNVFQLRSQKGKHVVIFFGTTWCPSCRTELPRYKKIYETYAGRGLEVIYINIMEPREKVAKFVRENSLPFRILLDVNGSVADSYAVLGVPTIVLIDGDGKLVMSAHTTAELPLKKIFPGK